MILKRRHYELYVIRCFCIVFHSFIFTSLYSISLASYTDFYIYCYIKALQFFTYFCFVLFDDTSLNLVFKFKVLNLVSSIFLLLFQVLLFLRRIHFVDYIVQRDKLGNLLRIIFFQRYFKVQFVFESILLFFIFLQNSIQYLFERTN